MKQKNKEQQPQHKINRRALLGAISTAGVVGATQLPGQWTKPVVDHVLLPAHAQTTLTSIDCVVTCSSGLRIDIALINDASNTSQAFFLQTSYSSYTQCEDSFGGFSSSFILSSSLSVLSGTGTTFSATQWLSSSPSFISDSICNVTMTS